MRCTNIKMKREKWIQIQENNIKSIHPFIYVCVSSLSPLLYLNMRWLHSPICPSPSPLTPFVSYFSITPSISLSHTTLHPPPSLFCVKVLPQIYTPLSTYTSTKKIFIQKTFTYPGLKHFNIASNSIAYRHMRKHRNTVYRYKNIKTI